MTHILDINTTQKMNNNVRYCSTVNINIHIGQQSGILIQIKILRTRDQEFASYNIARSWSFLDLRRESYPWLHVNNFIVARKISNFQSRNDMHYVKITSFNHLFFWINFRVTPQLQKFWLIKTFVNYYSGRSKLSG